MTFVVFQTLADILSTAAKEDGIIDPHKVEKILKVSLKTEEIVTSQCNSSTHYCHKYNYLNNVWKLVGLGQLLRKLNRPQREADH